MRKKTIIEIGITLIIGLFCLFLGLGASGCAGDYRSAVKAKGEGTIQIYNISFDKVWHKTPGAFGYHGIEIDEWYKSKKTNNGWIAGHKNSGAAIVLLSPVLSWGEQVALFVDEVSPEQTQVEVVSMRYCGLQPIACNWEKSVLERLSEILKKEYD